MFFKKKVRCITLILLFLSSSMALIAFFLPFHKEGTYCHANIHDYIGNEKIIYNIHISLGNGNGDILMNGYILNGNLHKSPFYLRKYYEYSHDNGRIYLKQKNSKTIMSENTDSSLLSKYINSFYLTPNSSGVSKKIQVLDNSGKEYIIFANNIPYAICISDE